MKKKLLVLLSSVVAGVGLVGATFAAWAVTDEADPLGIKITPQEMSEATDTYSTMTLQWGDKAAFTDVSGMKLTDTKEVSIGVKSTVTHAGDDDETGGKFTLSLEDYTEEKNIVPGAPRLYQNLLIKVYKASTKAEGDLVFTMDGTASGSGYVDTPVNGDQKLLYITIQFKSGVTAAQYNQMQKDVVYLFADWGQPDGLEEISTRRLYYTANETGLEAGSPRAYAYKQTGETIAKNAVWPGVEMEVFNTTAKVYYVDIEIGKFNNIIFSYGSDGANQTADLAIPAAGDNTPLYNGTAWAELGEIEQDVQESVYYLVGNVSGWGYENEYKLTKSGDNYTLDITVPTDGLVYKIRDQVKGTWYSYSSTDGGAENCTWNNGGDQITITFNPNKTLADSTCYVTQAKAK